MEKLIHKKETYDIVGVCMEVYNILGFGFLEVVYKDAMELEFALREMKYSREHELSIQYKDFKLKRSFFVDFTLYENIIVEVKANSDGIADDAIAQTLNYLKASGKRLGIIVNFGKRNLEYKRIVF